LGVVGGYFLGRTKKMKFAMMLGGMAAGRRAGGPGQLLAEGTKLLGQSPELARLTNEIRGRLLDAGKGAAVAVATRQVENLTERVLSRVGTLADTGGKTVNDVGDAAGGIVSDVGKAVGGLGRRQSGDDVESDEKYEEASDEAADEEYEEASDEAADEEYEEASDEAADEELAEASDEASDEESGEDAGGGPTDLEEPVEDTRGGPAEGEGDEEEAEQAPAPRRRPAGSAAGKAGAGGAGRGGSRTAGAR
jgi:hypothetical protein